MTTHDSELMTTTPRTEGAEQAASCSKPRVTERDDWNQRYAFSDSICAISANRFLTTELAIDCLVRGTRS